MPFQPLGDSAVTLLTDGPDRAQGIARAIAAASLPGVQDVFAAFDGVTVFYELTDLRLPFSNWLQELERVAASASDRAAGKEQSLLEIPTQYGGEHGPDLYAICDSKGMSEETLIALHCATEYTVLAIGFLPGFAYLGGLPEVLRTPRRSTPRTRVAAGSVGIGGTYTGVYPIASPGGWNVIGRTKLRLFDPSRDPYTPFHVGMRVRFVKEC
jgi:inhibitor of KinA